MEERKVALIGSGNFAWHLMQLFTKVNAQPILHYARNEEAFAGFPSVSGAKRSTHWEDLFTADVCFLAVSDRSISPLSSKLLGKDQLIIHVSGGKSIDAIKGKRRAVFYLPQTLTKGRPIDLSDVFACIEADRADDLLWLNELAIQMGIRSIEMSSEKRKHLHLAAVFTNNFSNHMLSVASSILKENGLPTDILNPLVRETAEKAIELGPENAQTGPAIRGDLPTIRKHLRMLKSISIRRLYRQISDHIFAHRGKQL